MKFLLCLVLFAAVVTARQEGPPSDKAIEDAIKGSDRPMAPGSSPGPPEGAPASAPGSPGSSPQNAPAATPAATPTAAPATGPCSGKTDKDSDCPALKAYCTTGSASNQLWMTQNCEKTCCTPPPAPTAAPAAAPPAPTAAPAAAPPAQTAAPAAAPAALDSCSTQTDADSDCPSLKSFCTSTNAGYKLFMTQNCKKTCCVPAPAPAPAPAVARSYLPSAPAYSSFASPAYYGNTGYYGASASFFGNPSAGAYSGASLPYNYGR